MRILVGGALLAGPTALAFATGGFFDTPRTVAAIVAWLAVAVLVLSGAPLVRGRAAWLAITALVALAAWTAISLSWAPLIEPARDDLVRIVGYAGALAASALMWQRRSDARLVEPLLAAGALVVVGYGLSGRLLPGVIDLDRSLSAAGRLEQPLTYWNAMGALAAIGLTLAVRVAGDTTRVPWLRAAAAGAAPALGLGVYLSFSRGAAAALAAGLLVLLALMPYLAQIRAATIALAASLLAALGANLLPGVESLSGSSPERDGAVALIVLAILSTVAAAVQLRLARREAAAGGAGRRLRLPRRAAVAVLLVAGLAGGPLIAVALDRAATSEPADAGARRFAEVGSNRYAYWEVALRSFADHPLEGTGAAGFRVEWLRERDIDETVQDAHSLYLETAAELGVVGLALLLLLVAGVATAGHATLRSDRELATGWAAATVVFAVAAALDWHWEMPAVAYPALVLTGALLARAGAVTRAGGSAS